MRIEGPNGIDLRTDLFAVSGKLSEVVRPTPLIPLCSIYSRHTENGDLRAQQDVFVLAPPPPGSATLTSQVPNLPLTEANGTGTWYAQSALNPALPTSLLISADNSVAIPTSSVTEASLPLTDLVTITKAEYSLANATLSVIAISSDETSPPAMTARTGNGTFIGNFTGDGAQKGGSNNRAGIIQDGQDNYAAAEHILHNDGYVQIYQQGKQNFAYGDQLDGNGNTATATQH